MNSRDELYNDLRDRIELLSRGIAPPSIKGKTMYRIGGTGTGVGPQGTKFFVSKNGIPKGMISLPLFKEGHHLSQYSIKTTLNRGTATIECENGIELKGVPLEKFIGMKLNDGTPIVGEGLCGMHCNNTIIVGHAFKCIHAVNDKTCKYCEIDTIARQVWGWPDIVPIEHTVEAIQIAQQHDNIRSITISTGTFASNDEVVERYIAVLKEIKKVTTLSIHIQFEPVPNLDLLNKLSGLADSVGIFREILDENIRKEICPGKFSNSKKEDYIKNWTRAVEVFGRGNVVSTCLLGFHEDFDTIIKEIEQFCSIGVIPIILFTRFRSKQLASKVPSYLEKNVDELVAFHIETANIMKKNNLYYKKGVGSGCIGCQGCSAMMEASEFVRRYDS